jgi:hypothetical protein
MTGVDLNAISLERVSRVTPLGLCLFDLITGKVVSDGIDVVASPVGAPGNRVPGLPNRRGFFTFKGLAGLRDFEYGSGDEDFWGHVHSTRSYEIAVSDRWRRYQPFIVSLELPLRGLLLWTDQPFTSPAQECPYLPLYSSPTRQWSGPHAVVRAELVDASHNIPAAWAMVEVRAGTTRLGRSYADAQGRVAIHFPYPEPSDGPSSSPPLAGTVRPYTDSQWDIELSVFYSGLSASCAPDLINVCKQPQVLLQIDQSTSLPALDLTIEYNKELTVKSPSKSVLLIRS